MTVVAGLDVMTGVILVPFHVVTKQTTDFSLIPSELLVFVQAVIYNSGVYLFLAISVTRLP